MAFVLYFLITMFVIWGIRTYPADWPTNADLDTSPWLQSVGFSLITPQECETTRAKVRSEINSDQLDASACTFHDITSCKGRMILKYVCMCRSSFIQVIEP